MLTTFSTYCWAAVVIPPAQSHHNSKEQQFLKSLSIQGVHWGTYNPWSNCSKTCGTGLEHRERQCLNYLNDPVDIHHCNGTAKEYKVCRLKHCRDPNESNYRLQQCSQFEYDELRWKPHIGNTEFPVDPCALTCYAIEDHHRVEMLSDSVPSGTPCLGLEGTMQYQGLCLDGQCLVVGCDRLLNSSKTSDQCGVCGGDGLSCQPVSGTFVRENLQVGYTYTEVLEIPVGARNIHVYEMERSKNYLAVADGDGIYYLNGDMNINQPGRYRIAGTMFRYQRRTVWNMGQWREEPELLTAQGPTDKLLIILVLKAESTAHIVYDYTVPIHVSPAQLNPNTMQSSHKDTLMQEITHSSARTEENENDVENTAVTMETDLFSDEELEDVTDEDFSVETVKEGGVVDVSNSSNFEELQSESDISSLHRTNGSAFTNGNLLTKSNQTVAKSTIEPDVVVEEKGGKPIWQYPSKAYRTNMLAAAAHYDSSTEPSVHFEQEQQVSLQQRQMLEDVDDFGSENDQQVDVKPTNTSRKPVPATSKEKDVNRESGSSSSVTPSLLVHPTEDLPRSELLPSGVVISHSKPLPFDYHRPLTDNTSEQEELNEPNVWDNVAETTDGPLSSDGSSSSDDYEGDVIPIEVPSQTHHRYRWKKTGLAPCTSTCRRGVRTAYVFCERDDGVQADDYLCDLAVKPSVLPVQCGGRHCEPRWENGDWSQCTRSCSGGMCYRTVHCWRMLAPGIDSSVSNSLCNATEIPEHTRTCAEEPCGPQWETSDWSECSTTCGPGKRTREVTCSSTTIHCNPSLKSATSKSCNEGTCPSWTPAQWSQCPGPCKIQHRDVQCRNRTGHLLSDDSCPVRRRPFTAQLCGRNCHSKWVPQEFSSCNGTCGDAYRERKVPCFSIRQGRLRIDNVCPEWEMPNTREACRLPHCAENAPKKRHHSQPIAKWLTTTWSQCSVTCGSGVKTRQVRCSLLNGGKSSCNAAGRPESQMTCVTPACPVQSRTCSDSPTANCRLILSANLCQYPTYKRTCCLTCPP